MVIIPDNSNYTYKTTKTHIYCSTLVEELSIVMSMFHVCVCVCVSASLMSISSNCMSNIHHIILCMLSMAMAWFSSGVTAICCVLNFIYLQLLVCQKEHFIFCFTPAEIVAQLGE